MAYKLDKPEANSDLIRLERWANMVVDLLIFALDDIDKRLDELKGTEGQDLQDRTGVLLQKIDALKTDLETLTESVGNLGDVVGGLQDDYGALELRVQALEGEGE